MSSRISPFLYRLYSGRSTELCSNTVVITCPPRFKVPKIAVFKASVQFLVNATRSGRAENIPARVSLHEVIIFSPASDSLCPLLPGFAQRYLITVTAASVAACGLKPPVAALSK